MTTTFSVSDPGALALVWRYCALARKKRTTPVTEACEAGDSFAVRTLMRFPRHAQCPSLPAAAVRHRKPTESCWRYFAHFLDMSAAERATAALCVSVRNGNMRAVAELIESGADVNVVTAEGESLLMIALENDRRQMTRFLVSEGADLFGNNEMNCRRAWGVSFLLAQGVDVNGRCRRCRPLFQMFQYRSELRAEELDRCAARMIERCADLDSRGDKV